MQPEGLIISESELLSTKERIIKLQYEIDEKIGPEAYNVYVQMARVLAEKYPNHGSVASWHYLAGSTPSTLRKLTQIDFPGNDSVIKVLEDFLAESEK
jgi:hypothetical protein